MNTIHLTGIRGIAQQIEFALEDDASTNIIDGLAFQQADCEISKDGGAFAQCTNTLAKVAGTNADLCKITLTAAECGCRRAVLLVIDNAGGPDWKEALVIIDFTPFEYDDAIYVDATNGTASTDHPYGTKRFPTNTLARAMTISDATKIRKIIIKNMSGDTDFAGAVTNNYTFEREGGEKGAGASVRFQSKSVSNCDFFGLELKLHNVGSGCRYKNCILNNSGMKLGTNAILEDCHIVNKFTPNNGTQMINCFNKDAIEIDCDQITTTLDIIGHKGDLEVDDLAAGVVNIYGGEGKLDLPADNDGGTINIFGGNWDLQDNSAAGCTVNNYEADLSQLHGAGSWVAGGTSIRDNYRKKNTQYDTNGNPTYYEEWIYGNAADAAADENETKKIGVWNTWTQDAVLANKYKLTAQLKKDIT